VSPAEECKKKGWIWDGKQCVQPPSPQCEAGWREVNRTTAKMLRAQGWEIKTVTSGGQSILCAKAPSLSCVGGQVKNGICICPRGTDRKQTGPNAFSCEPKAATVTCINGKLRDGKCVCRGGFELKQTGTNAFSCEPKAGVGVLPSNPAQPSQPPPATIPQLKPIPGQPLQIICPTGTVWSDTYKKCMPRID
jgi:hypothetical protein